MNTNKIMDVSVWIITESRHESTRPERVGLGDPADPTTAIGPMVSQKQSDRVQS